MTPPAGGSDALAALAQLAAAITPPPPPPDPLAVARGLAEAAELGAWLSVAELARLLGVAPGTVRGWSSGQGAVQAGVHPQSGLRRRVNHSSRS